MRTLGKTLASIALSGDPKYLHYREPAPVPKRDQAGPNAWDFCKDRPETFGPCEDFTVVDGDVFMAVSQAALNWAYAHLPADIDRYQITGFRVGPQWIGHIVHMARKDKLMSRDDYEQAMNENNELQRQGS